MTRYDDQLYYRRDAMENPEYQAKFKAKYGYDLAPPKTWKEVRDTAEFFNGWDWDGDGRKEYGAARYSSALDAQLSTALCRWENYTAGPG